MSWSRRRVFIGEVYTNNGQREETLGTCSGGVLHLLDGLTWSAARCPTIASLELTILNNDVLVNLNGLQGITYVGDTTSSVVEGVTIERNDALLNLTGLDNLTTVGNDCIIENNGTLISLQGLDGLTTVGDNFYIQLHSSLTVLDGLESLTTVGGRLKIQDNHSLCESSAEEVADTISYGSRSVYDEGC